MTRRELESALLTLETTPVLLERLIGGISAAARAGAASPHFEPTLEAIAVREDRLWGRWIELLMSERSPLLPDLDPREPRAAAPGRPLESFDLFREARGKNLLLLRKAPGHLWDRAGVLETGGLFHLRDLPAAMADGDRKDLDEILGGRPLSAASPHRVSLPDPGELAHRR